MVNESRTGIYEYLYNLFYGVVTENVYMMNEPQELTQSDATDGFIVVVVGSIYDQSEFSLQAYGFAQCFVIAYVPPISRGRLDEVKYKEFEDGINAVIENATLDNDGTYYIQNSDILSTDTEASINSDSLFFTFAKSFIVNINES